MKLKQYDAQEEARLISVSDSKEKERVDVATRIQGMIDEGESKAWDDAQHLEFRQLKERHDWLRQEIGDIKSDLEAMAHTKPVEQPDRVIKDNPLLRWIKKGHEGLDSHELKDQEEYRESMGLSGRKAYVDPIFRAVVPASAANEKTLDDTVVQDVIVGLDAFGDAMQCFTVATTPDGNSIKYPLYDDVVSGARRRANKVTGNAATQQDTAQGTTALSSFDDVELNAWVRTTGYLDVSRYFNEDVRWDVGAFVRKVLMNRMGRTIEDELTNGGIAVNNAGVVQAAVENIANPTGALDQEPTGFIVRAGRQNYSNLSTNAGTKAAIKWEDLNTLIHSINRAYLRGEVGLYGYPHRPGKTGFMTSWAFLGALKNISDTQNRPIVLPSVREGTVDTMFGYPIFINDEIPHTSFDTQWFRPIFFGNFGYMTCRFSGAGFAIEEHYDSNTAPENASRFLGRIRYDSDYIGNLDSESVPKGKAIKALARHLAA